MHRTSITLTGRCGSGRVLISWGATSVFAGRQAKLYLIDCFAKDAIMLKIITTLTAIQEGDLEKFPDTKSFSDRYIPYLEVSLETKVSTVVDQVLSGPLALIVQGYPEAIMIDARTYPTRSLQEPDSDRCCAAPGTALLKRWSSIPP